MFVYIMLFFEWFQYVSEKIGGAKGTELDDEFVDMEKVFKSSWSCIIHDIHDYCKTRKTCIMNPSVLR